jgi:hypothetical protein
METNLTNDQQDLIDFAYRISRLLGANLSILLRTGVVFISKEWQFRELLKHLQTNKDFGLVTGFEYNQLKRCIWLDHISKPLKDILKANDKINWTK